MLKGKFKNKLAVELFLLFFAVAANAQVENGINYSDAETIKKEILLEQSKARIEEFYGVPYDLSFMPEEYDPSELIIAVNDILLKLDIDIAGVAVLGEGLAFDFVRIAKTSKVNKDGKLAEEKFVLLISSDLAENPNGIINIIKEEKAPTEAEVRQNEVNQIRRDTVRSVLGDKYLSEEEKKKITAQMAQKSADFLEGFKETLEKGINFGDKKVKIKIYDYYKTYGEMFAREDVLLERDSIEAVKKDEKQKEQQQKEFFSNGKVKTIVNYKNGKKNGLSVEYYDNGNKKKEEKYKDNELDGKVFEYYPTGKVKSVSNYIAGKLEGLIQEYYEDGAVSKTMFYSNNQLGGQYKSYYKNGVVSTEVQYKNGQRDGAYKEYFEDGKTKYLEEYKNGVVDGIAREYYPNGQLQYENSYAGGALDGESKYYYENGVIKYLTTYRGGKLNGVAKDYSQIGEEWAEYYYENDVLISNKKNN